MENGLQSVDFLPFLMSFQVSDAFWGWNNEVHVFDPSEVSWNDPQTHASIRLYKGNDSYADALSHF